MVDRQVELGRNEVAEQYMYPLHACWPLCENPAVACLLSFQLTHGRSGSLVMSSCS